MKKFHLSLLAVVLLVAGCATTPQGKIVQTAQSIDAIVMPAAHIWADYVAAGLATAEQNAAAEKAYTAYCNAFAAAQQVTLALRAGTATVDQATAATAALVSAANDVLAVVKLFLPPGKLAGLKLAL